MTARWKQHGLGVHAGSLLQHTCLPFLFSYLQVFCCFMYNIIISYFHKSKYGIFFFFQEICTSKMKLCVVMRAAMKKMKMKLCGESRTEPTKSINQSTRPLHPPIEQSRGSNMPTMVLLPACRCRAGKSRRDAAT